jgi:hypothetical protein
MSNIAQARIALVARILEGEGKASRIQRRAAFDNAELATPLNKLIDKVTKHAYRVTDEDIAAVKASASAMTRSSKWWCAPRSARPADSTTKRSGP